MIYTIHFVYEPTFVYVHMKANSAKNPIYLPKFLDCKSIWTIFGNFICSSLAFNCKNL